MTDDARDEARDDARDPAAERLLDAALEQVLGARAHAAPRSPQWWWAAAALFAITVVTATWWTARLPHESVGQGPDAAALPPLVDAADAAALAALPADVADLRVRIVGADALPRLLRFHALRRLELVATERGEHASDRLLAWDARPEQFAVLAQLPALRELQLDGAVPAALLDGLASVPLERLRLPEPRSADADWWRALGRLHTLRALDLREGGPTLSFEEAIAVAAFLADTWTDAAAAAVAELVNLRELHVGALQLTAGALAKLPVGLEVLDLGWQQRDVAELGSVGRLVSLRDLTLFQRLVGGRLVGLLEGHSLRRLATGPIGAGDLDAIARQSELRELSLVVPEVIDMAPLARLAHLQTLHVDVQVSGVDLHATGSSDYGLCELAKCKELRRVEWVSLNPIDDEKVEQALGPKVSFDLRLPNRDLRWQPAQQPAREKAPQPMVSARTIEELDAVPATAERLTIALQGPGVLSRLSRFTAIRELCLMGGSITELGDDVLAPLQQLTMLERLELPTLPRMSATWLGPLRALPRLRTLLLDDVECTPAMADALAALPQLRELSLRNARIAAGFFAHLQPLGLRRLSLQSPVEFGADRQADIAELRTLQALDILVPVKVNAQWLPFDRGALAVIARLPALRELSFGTGQDDEDQLLEVLPATLTKLWWTRPVTTASAAGLRRFAALRDLHLTASDDEAADATAGLVGALRLRSFSNVGVTTPALLRALAAQPDLDSVDMKLRQGTDLALLAKAPKLRDLTLSGYGAFKLPTDYTPTLADVQPLASCPSLRRLRLINCGLGAAEVQAALGKQVVVEVEELL